MEHTSTEHTSVENIKVQRDKKWAKLANNVYELQCKLKELKDKERALLAELVKESENTNSFFEGLSLSLVNRPGSIKYSSIPEIKELNLDQYRGNPTSYWKLSKRY